MSYISDIHSLLLDELRTDKRGLSCDPDTFNRLIRLVNQELFDQYVQSFESGQESSDTLGFLKVHNYSLPLTAGVASLPASYERLIGKPRVHDGTMYRNVDVVSTYEQACRNEDYLTISTVVDATATIGGVDGLGNVQIRVYPTTITNGWIDYLRTLTVPFLDYYVNDTSLVPTFLEASTTYNLLAGYRYRTGTVGGAGVTVASTTVDMKWGEGDIALILTKLINRLAKQLPDELLLQQTNAEQAKSEA